MMCTCVCVIVGNLFSVVFLTRPYAVSRSVRELTTPPNVIPATWFGWCHGNAISFTQSDVSSSDGRRARLQQLKTDQLLAWWLGWGGYTRRPTVVLVGLEVVRLAQTDIN